MAAVGHFRGNEHAGLFLDSGEPFEARSTHTLEASGFGARFPDTGAENAYAVGGELPGGVEGLLLGFGAARAGYHKRTPVDTFEMYGLQFNHSVKLRQKIGKTKPLKIKNTLLGKGT